MKIDTDSDPFLSPTNTIQGNNRPLSLHFLLKLTLLNSRNPSSLPISHFECHQHHDGDAGTSTRTTHDQDEDREPTTTATNGRYDQWHMDVNKSSAGRKRSTGIPNPAPSKNTTPGAIQHYQQRTGILAEECSGSRRPGSIQEASSVLWVTRLVD